MPTSTSFLGGENRNMGGRQRETRWLTPPSIVTPLGDFDLDPCGAPGHELADTTYQIDNGEDGLNLPWFGRVWLNPPYGRAADLFLEKMVEHGKGTALLFARTETKSFQERVWGNATGALFLRGRITFLTSDGVPAKNSSGAPSVLIAYGKEDADQLKDSRIAGKYIDINN